MKRLKQSDYITSFRTRPLLWMGAGAIIVGAALIGIGGPLLSSARHVAGWLLLAIGAVLFAVGIVISTWKQKPEGLSTAVTDREPGNEPGDAVRDDAENDRIRPGHSQRGSDR